MTEFVTRRDGEKLQSEYEAACILANQAFDERFKRNEAENRLDRTFNALQAWRRRFYDLQNGQDFKEIFLC